MRKCNRNMVLLAQEKLTFLAQRIKAQRLFLRISTVVIRKLFLGGHSVAGLSCQHFGRLRREDHFSPHLETSLGNIVKPHPR